MKDVASTQTITAKDQSKAYGQAMTLDSTQFTATGLINGDAITSLTLASAGTAATAAAGSYSIVPSAAVGTGLSNYTIAYKNGTLNVGAATLTITAKDQSKAYGQAMTLDSTQFTATGLINGDAI